MTLRLADTTEVSAELVYKREDGENIMLIFKTNKNVEDLISYRKITLDVIWWSYSGLKVPNSALMQDGELNYVIRNRTGYKDKIYVNVLKQNQNYSIITNYTAAELQELGWSQDEITSRKSIALYDEVAINSDE